MPSLVKKHNEKLPFQKERESEFISVSIFTFSSVQVFAPHLMLVDW